MNKKRSVRDNIFRKGGGRWNTSYYDASQEGESSQGGGRKIGRGRRDGGRSDLNIDVASNPTSHI